jgi:hypothetical protein
VWTWIGPWNYVAELFVGLLLWKSFPSGIFTRRCTGREEPAGRLLQDFLGQDQLQLMEQRLSLGPRELVLIQPADIDAVMDMYIRRGKSMNNSVTKTRKQNA